MNGMLMMLKSFGIDPTELVAQAENIRQLAQDTHDTMVRIEANQLRILTILEPNAQLEKGADNGETENSDSTGNSAAA